MAKAWYNDIDKDICAWAKELVRRNLVTPGEVICSDMREVTPPKDVDRAHWFCGILGWDLALTKANWPDDISVWTASLPCQPFSNAGVIRGFEDDRHLWPAFFLAVKERRPEFIFGEQVSSKAGLRWMDVVASDLEAADYTVGFCVLGAHSVGLPHLRQRLYWCALENSRSDERRQEIKNKFRVRLDEKACNSDGSLENGSGSELERWSNEFGEDEERFGKAQTNVCVFEEYHPAFSLADGDIALCEEQRESENEIQQSSSDQRANGLEIWHSYDGKYRPLSESGVLPCIDGVSRRVVGVRPSRVQLFGYGNAIVPEIGARFIQTVMEYACEL